MEFFSTRNLRKGKQQFMQQRLKGIDKIRQVIKLKGAVPKDYSKTKLTKIFNIKENQVEKRG